MKYYLLTIGLAISFVTTGQKFKPLTIDPEREFKISREDSLYDVWGEGFNKSEFLKITSDLSMPTNDHPSQKTYEIRFTKAEIKGDTVNILIHETNPAYHYEYRIEIIKNKYRVSYNFLTSGEIVDRKIKTEDFKLVLNTSDFKQGQEIRGYTEFKGKCIKGCWTGFAPIDIKGSFKVTLD